MKKAIVLIIVLILLGGGLWLGWKWVKREQRLATYRQAAQKKAQEAQVTLIEGWTIKDIAAYLDQQGIVKAADFIAEEKAMASAATSGDFSILQSKPKTADLEGLLFPDTYRLAKYQLTNATTTSDIIIKKALQNFSQKFTPEMVQQAQAKSLTPYQIVILASIIEKESGGSLSTSQSRAQLDEQRKMIAGIFYNRLRAGQPLESDATINYITQKNDRQASLDDTKIDSPYNTYKYAGLPPTPIGSPSLSSLQAALNPTANSYYYFLHKPDGSIVYSVTYQEHLLNKQKYLK